MMPLPGSQLDRLVQLIRAAASAGTPLPTTEGMAEALGLDRADVVTKLLREAEKRGLLVVQHGRVGISAIEAPDGSWRAIGAVAARGQGRLPPRRCLRCQHRFEPTHRHNFLCGCQAQAEGVA